uniref:Putative pentatricopeptide repeat-containing protein At5g09950 n=1 Tax=Rhizophora mucronata TaxID=61149 RepID=A0A2P2MY64_RHIMU
MICISGLQNQTMNLHPKRKPTVGKHLASSKSTAKSKMIGQKPLIKHPFEDPNRLLWHPTLVIARNQTRPRNTILVRHFIEQFTSRARITTPYIYIYKGITQKQIKIKPIFENLQMKQFGII